MESFKRSENVGVGDRTECVCNVKPCDAKFDSTPPGVFDSRLQDEGVFQVAFEVKEALVDS